MMRRTGRADPPEAARVEEVVANVPSVEGSE